MADPQHERTKPIVIFAGNYASVDMLHDALAKAGHRVAVLDGRKSTKENNSSRTRARSQRPTSSFCPTPAPLGSTCSAGRH